MFAIFTLCLSAIDHKTRLKEIEIEQPPGEAEPQESTRARTEAATNRNKPNRHGSKIALLRNLYMILTTV